MPRTPRLVSHRRAFVSVGALLALVTLAAVLPAHAGAAQTAAVQAHLLWSRYDGADVSRQLDEAKRAGAGMVRVDLGWASLEQAGKGRYNSWYLAKIDRVVDEAEARGIEVLFTVWETPCWASTAPDSVKQECAGAWWDRGVQRYPPEHASDYADALAYLIARYGSRVAAWEVWNEPNHGDFFKAPDKVASYAALVKAAYPAAKAADPAATIIAGSLADADYEFTRALYDAGIKGSFDAWSVHPYSEDRSPLHPGIAGWEKKSFVSGVPRVRETMLDRGDDKPLWLTEFGWSTCDVRGLAAYRNCVDDDVQGDYLRQAFAQMQTLESYVSVGVWFNLQDTSADRGDRVDNYGLLTFGGAEKPAFAAFQASAQAMSSGEPVPAAAVSEPDPDAASPVVPGPEAAPSLPTAPPPGSPAPAPSPAAALAPGAELDAEPLPTRVRPSEAGSEADGSRADGYAERIAPGDLILRVVRRNGRVRIAGTLGVGRTLHVRAYPWKRRAGRFSRRTRYRRLIQVAGPGRFRHLIASSALRRGKWKILVKGRRLPRLQATAIVG